MVERGNVFSPAILFLFVFWSLPEHSQTNVMITRPGSSDSDCAKRCKEEQDVSCRYYKWHPSKLSCFLSANNDTSLSNMKKIEKPPNTQPAGTKPASSWIAQLQSRVLLLEKKDVKIKCQESVNMIGYDTIDKKIIELQREIADLRTEIAGLKNSRALTHHLIRTNKEQQDDNMEAINEKADVLKSEAKRMQDALMTLGEIQKSFGKKITEINEDRKSSGLTMAMLGQSNKDIKSSIKELSVLSTQVQQSISDIRKEMTDVEVRFAGLSTDVMEKAASIESMIGPEVKEMKDTQTNLAQALSLITKKIMRLTPRIPELQRLVSTNDGMVSAVAKKVKEFHKSIEQLTGRVGFAESQLRNFLDPGSKLSQDRRLLISHLREDVQSLRSSQKRLQSDVLMEISDRTRLYKELSQIKLSKKMFVSDVNNLRQQFKKMDKEMRNIILNGPQGDLISKILHRQVEVLKKMKLVQEQQANMRDDMGRFSKEMREFGSISLDAGTNDGNILNRSNELKTKMSQMETKLKNLSLTNEKLQSLQDLERQLNYGLQRAALGRIPSSPEVNPYTRPWRQQQDRLEMERLRGRTDALGDLVHRSVDQQGVIPAKSNLQNLILKHRDELGQRAVNQHINEHVNDIIVAKDASSASSALQDHLESLHHVLSSLAQGEEKGQ